MPKKYTMRSKEEKLAIVKRNLSGEAARVLAREIGCSDRQVRDWVKASGFAASADTLGGSGAKEA